MRADAVRCSWGRARGSAGQRTEGRGQSSVVRPSVHLRQALRDFAGSACSAGGAQREAGRSSGGRAQGSRATTARRGSWAAAVEGTGGCCEAN